MSAGRKKKRRNAGKVRKPENAESGGKTGKPKNAESGGKIGKPKNADDGGEKPRKKSFALSSGAVRRVLIAAVLLAAVLTAVIWKACGETDEGATELESSASSETDAGTAEDATGEDTLPEIRNTESLTLSSVYTSDILNPDCGLAYAEEVASLEVTNSSDRYLVAATIEGIMSDGTEVTFQVQDLPAGATAEIFDTGNQTLSTGATCTSLTCTSEEYLDGTADVLMSSLLQVTVSGQDAVITNISTGMLQGLTVVYHCDMSGRYFGGASYTVTIDSLAAGESYTLSDSGLFGAVGVARVYR